MIPNFYCKKNICGTGSKVIIDFIKQFQSEFCKKIKKYAAHRKKDNYFEHLFYYGEQQTKTYITSILDRLCDTNFMQETQVERRIKRYRGKHHLLNSGRVDYWCRYGNTIKISLLFEIKQAWLRIYNHNKWTIYREIPLRHLKAVEQLAQIKDKSQFTSDSLYSLALTVIPLYMRYNSAKDSVIELKENIMKKIANEVMGKTVAHAYGYWIIPKEYCPIASWNEGYIEKKIFENHPGIIFIWSIQKITRG
jgi:hypothetical protein